VLRGALTSTAAATAALAHAHSAGAALMTAPGKRRSLMPAESLGAPVPLHTHASAGSALGGADAPSFAATSATGSAMRFAVGADHLSFASDPHLQDEGEDGIPAGHVAAFRNRPQMPVLSFNTQFATAPLAAGGKRGGGAAKSNNNRRKSGSYGASSQPTQRGSSAPPTHSALTLLDMLRSVAAASHAAFTPPEASHSPFAVHEADNGQTGGAGDAHAAMPDAAGSALARLYVALVLPLKTAAERARLLLRVLPSPCFAPQTYDSMRALLAQLPSVSHRVFADLTQQRRQQHQQRGGNGGGGGAGGPVGRVLMRALHKRGGALPPLQSSLRHLQHPTDMSRTSSAVQSTPAKHLATGAAGEVASVDDINLVEDGELAAAPKLGGQVIGSDAVAVGREEEEEEEQHLWASDADIAADIGSWKELPDTEQGFLSALPPGCSAGRQI
jgi:hypothetical protein